MSRRSQALITGLWITLAAVPLIDGLPYFLTPLTERPFTPLHDLYKPSGLIGQGLGIVGSLMILVGVTSYSVRKRWSALHRFGKLRNWLTFHIFLCTLGPFFILLHTTFKIGNIVSIAFWSMAIVVSSGVFGRYVYVHIPKTMNGLFYADDQIEREQAQLAARLSALTGWDAERVHGMLDQAQPRPVRGLGDALLRTLRFDVRLPALRRRLTERLTEAAVPPETLSEALPLVVEHRRLSQQRNVSRPFQRLFGYWHVLHLPLALVLLVVFVIHVGVAIAFGYTWIF
ncbi:MAG: hypothetical protein GVY18_01030 [Bacteroidetes bacterium]|jgi:hypothetical protein|nr:hypothetical protein [Bacteroidota bacterium]